MLPNRAKNILLLLKSLSGKFKTHKTVILGDFNQPETDWSSYTSRDLAFNEIIEYLLENNFQQFVNVPTHKSLNTLDLVWKIFSDPFANEFEAKNVAFSDHKAIIFTIVSQMVNRNENPLPQLSPKNFAALADYLSESLFSIIQQNNAYYAENWLKTFQSYLHAFQTTKRKKRQQVPYFYSSHTMHLLNKRNTACRKHMKQNIPCNHQELDSSCEESIVLDTTVFLEQFCRQNSGIFGCYKLLNSLSTDNNLPQAFFDENDQTWISDPCKIANTFNNYFATYYEPSMSPFGDFSPNDHNTLIITFDDVNEALKKCTPGSGLDGIPGSFLSQYSTQLTFHIFKLFSAVANTGIYPNSWKFSFIKPTFKKGKKTDVTSYRPISNLSKLSLSFERILFNYLYQIIRDKIYKHQYGFVRKKSTVLQLIIFLDDIYQDIDNNRTAYCAYLDFSKAFDKVQHNLLLAKLRKFGIGGTLLKLIASYLSGRYQCVKFCNTFSDYQSVTSGVPQGSILGPLLFVIFINDLPQSCINSILYLYADDSKLKNNTSLTNFQLDLNNCLIWGDNNAMKFNSIKTNFLDFGTNSSTLFIKCAHDTIIPSELVKDLGVYFNEKLKWSQHISKKLSTCYGLFQDLKRQLPDKLDMRTKLRVYKQFLMPVLFYASEAWFPSSNDISRMERFQNHVSKWIVTERDYPSRLLKTELLPIKMALELKDILLFNKMVNGIMDFPVWDHIYIESATIYSLRRDAKVTFKPRYYRTKLCQSNFFNRATKYANFIQRHTTLDIMTDPNIFRPNLKKFFVAHFAKTKNCESYFNF